MEWMRKIGRGIRSPKGIISVITIAILAIIVYFSWGELVRAYKLLDSANLWLILLLIPAQIIVYFAGGEMIFSYLRDKKLIKHISWFEQARIALELNFVNHLFPSGGVSGISYASWRLHKLGVDSARATSAQVVRQVMNFIAFVALLVVAVIFLALDGGINRLIVAASFAIVLGIVMLTAILMFGFSSMPRLRMMASWFSSAANRTTKFVSFGRKKQVVNPKKVQRFAEEMHDDYRELMRDKKLLWKPFWWGVVYVIFDVLLFMIAFWSLGHTVNPAILLIGYGIAGIAGFIVLTPGGAGAYETIMILFLTMAGVTPDVAIAGIVLTRVILLLGTIIFGYIFYQMALVKYAGKSKRKLIK